MNRLYRTVDAETFPQFSERGVWLFAYQFAEAFFKLCGDDAFASRPVVEGFDGAGMAILLDNLLYETQGNIEAFGDYCLGECALFPGFDNSLSDVE